MPTPLHSTIGTNIAKHDGAFIAISRTSSEIPRGLHGGPTGASRAPGLIFIRFTHAQSARYTTAVKKKTKASQPVRSRQRHPYLRLSRPIAEPNLIEKAIPIFLFQRSCRGLLSSGLSLRICGLGFTGLLITGLINLGLVRGPVWCVVLVIASVGHTHLVAPVPVLSITTEGRKAHRVVV